MFIVINKFPSFYRRLASLYHLSSRDHHHHTTIITIIIIIIIIIFTSIIVIELMMLENGIRPSDFSERPRLKVTCAHLLWPTALRRMLFHQCSWITFKCRNSQISIIYSHRANVTVVIVARLSLWLVSLRLSSSSSSSSSSPSSLIC